LCWSAVRETSTHVGLVTSSDGIVGEGEAMAGLYASQPKLHLMWKPASMQGYLPHLDNTQEEIA
jgi:hypothetical protein